MLVLRSYGGSKTGVSAIPAGTIAAGLHQHQACHVKRGSCCVAADFAHAYEAVCGSPSASAKVADEQGWCQTELRLASKIIALSFSG